MPRARVRELCEDDDAIQQARGAGTVGLEDADGMLWTSWSYKDSADGVLDVWACCGKYCRCVYPVPGYEFDEGFMISRDKLMSTRF